MKKIILFLSAIFMLSTAYPQRFQVVTNTQPTTFKRHYTYSIEAGFVGGQARQYIAGNQTDWLVNSKAVKGNGVYGQNFTIGKAVELTNESANIILTDFVIGPGQTYEYAAGTGMYFPAGPGTYAYPYLGIYERGTGAIINLVYFDLLYNGSIDEPRNTVATRVKYSRSQNAYYISGIMIDRLFIGTSFDDFYCHSQGFIMKVRPGEPGARVLIFDPDPIDNPEIPWMCSVNDMEIDQNEQFIYFTGVNTVKDFNGGNQPMAGKIDMDLNLQWCNTYNVSDTRYSGVDVELKADNSGLFVLSNSDRRPYSIMEVNGVDGIVLQNPVVYDFSMIPCNITMDVPPVPGEARAHMMHYTNSGGLIVTGNFYVDSYGTRYQSLFKYDIPDASNLSLGNTAYGTYSCDLVPLGRQVEVTSWWAPENSVLRGNDLYMVGAFNGGNDNGYTYIDVTGFDTSDPDCFRKGDVTISSLNQSFKHREAHMSECRSYDLIPIIYDWDIMFHKSCEKEIIHDKSMDMNQNKDSEKFWEFRSLDEGGIHLVLKAQTQSDYFINVYDVTGRVVCTANYNIDGEKEIELKFTTADQLYLISVSNGVKTETLKINGIR